MARPRLLPAALLALLGTSVMSAMQGCASADGMAEKFYDSSRAYNRSLRWEDFDRAARHLPPESVNAFLDHHEAIEDEIVIIDYDIERMKLEKQTGRAATRVNISWHRDDETIVRNTVVDQQWQFHDGTWFLVDEYRVDGKPLALFAESPDAEDEDEEGARDAEDPESDPESDREQSEGDEDALASADEADPRHPWLPGMVDFRESRDIGYSDQEKANRDRQRRRDRVAARKRQGHPRHGNVDIGGSPIERSGQEDDLSDFGSSRVAIED
jgi:hypothetical protein